MQKPRYELYFSRQWCVPEVSSEGSEALGGNLTNCEVLFRELLQHAGVPPTLQENLVDFLCRQVQSLGRAELAD